MKIFIIRVDVESDKGIKEGIPQFLDLLKKYNLKASFYLTMGGESNMLEIVRYNGDVPYNSERKIKVWSILDKLRMIFLPTDFVGGNKKILKRILREGHELGLHGWKHRAWTRGLDKINIDIHIKKSIDRYEEVFGATPISFCSPGFNINKKVLEVLERNNIKFISDFNGEKPSFYGKIKNVPITIKGEKNTPIIEYLISKGKSNIEVINFIKKEIETKNLASFYIHDLYEARFKSDILEEIFKYIIEQKISNMRIEDFK